jgi:TolB-like protein
LISHLSVGTLCHAEESIPLSAAVLNFKDGSEDLAGTGASVSALLQANLSNDSDTILVERAELGEIMSEHELILSDAVTPAQAAKVGQLTGAEVIISGRVFLAQDRVYLVAKVISSSSGRVFGVTSDYEKQGKMDSSIKLLSQSVCKILKDKQKDLRGAKSLEERQLESLKAAMKDKQAPKIYVSVSETIVRAAAPDPAAKTEICRALQAGGWTIAEAENEADVIVTGEAFAETGIRRDTLWFVRARLEFTVKNAAGKVLLTERVVAGNVDIAEAVGCKGALQKTGLLASTLIAEAWLGAQK